MYHVCVLATRRDPAATLIKALEGEGLSCSVVRDIQALSTGPTDGKVDARAPGWERLRPSGCSPGGATVPPVDTLQDIRSECVLKMMEIGIDVEVHHHEVATPGQGEIDMRFRSLTRMASQMTLHHIGGLFKHATAIMALATPTTNSYRRLVPGFEAPVNLVYSQRNRSAAARTPVYNKSPHAKRVEFRSPDPSIGTPNLVTAFRFGGTRQSLYIAPLRHCGLQIM